MRTIALFLVVLLVAACASAFVGGAQNACTAKGEVVGTASYDACVQTVAAQRQQDFSQRMSRVGAALSAAGGAQNTYSPPAYAAPPAPPAPGATGCMLRNQAVSGFNRICYYDCMGSVRAVTVNSTELCALSL